MLNKGTLLPKIKEVALSFIFEEITFERKNILQPLIDFIQLKVKNQEDIRLNFICTHNSRRSHLSEIWAQTAAHYYGIKNVFCYSGGTEATALFPKVGETLKNTGFKIQKLSEENNPVYAIKFAENESPVIGFSKTYDDEFNPESGFSAPVINGHPPSACEQVIIAAKPLSGLNSSSYVLEKPITGDSFSANFIT